MSAFFFFYSRQALSCVSPFPSLVWSLLEAFRNTARPAISLCMFIDRVCRVCASRLSALLVQSHAYSCCKVPSVISPFSDYDECHTSYLSSWPELGLDGCTHFLWNSLAWSWDISLTALDTLFRERSVHHTYTPPSIRDFAAATDNQLADSAGYVFIR